MLVFCGVWALWWWRISIWDVSVNALRTNACALPSAKNWEQEVLGEHGASCQEQSQRQDWESHAAPKKLAEIRQPYLARGVPNSAVMDLLFCGKVTNTRATKDGIRFRQWNDVVACWSLCKVDDSILVCSPEFLFHQICSEVRTMVPEHVDNRFYLVILAELGCELCGSYSRQANARGYKKRKTPLTSAAALLAYNGRMMFTYGARRMREVISWIINRLASPMETALYLLLCLPRTVGGLGIMRPIANPKVNIPEHLQWRWGKPYVKPDLFWPECDVVVEYDSNEKHQGQERRDADRRELLQDMGHIVIVFHADDIMDKGKFDAKVASLASHLGLALPPASDEFNALQAQLRNILLHHERWI